MFAAIYLDSQRNLVIPLRWIFSFELKKWVNDGINPSSQYKIFFSQDANETPNFSLPINVGEFYGQTGCYIAQIRKLFGKFIYKFFLWNDNVSFRIILFKDSNDEAEAKNFCERQRDIMPKSYVSHKVFEAASRSILFDENRDEIENFWNRNDNKEGIRETMENMQNMNDIFIDLSDSDVEDFQDILQDDDLDDTDTYFPDDIQVPKAMPLVEKTEPDANIAMIAPLSDENGLSSSNGTYILKNSIAIVLNSAYIFRFFLLEDASRPHVENASRPLVENEFTLHHDNVEMNTSNGLNGM